MNYYVRVSQKKDSDDFEIIRRFVIHIPERVKIPGVEAYIRGCLEVEGNPLQHWHRVSWTVLDNLQNPCSDAFFEGYGIMEL